MLSVVYIFFLCLEIATITVVASPSHGSKPESLHSYMEQMYNTRARGNGNGSFTISLRNQKVLATSIRGFEPEKNGTLWKGSSIKMQFRLGNAFKDDIVVEAELVVTSKHGSLSMSRKFNVSVYIDQPVLAPNSTRLLDSHAFPRRGNVEIGLNVTRAVKVWSLSSAKTYTIQLKVEDLAKHNGTKASVLNVWRCFKHGHIHGPFLVLYTQSKHPHNKDDIWKMVTLNWIALSSKPDNTTLGYTTIGKITQTDERAGKSDGRAPRHPSLTCYQVPFAVKMRDFYSNIIMPQTGYINYCDGYCYFPIQNHLTPTTHAVIWALWWKRYDPTTYTPKRPLCAPTKLGAQTVILSDPETGQPVQKEWQDFSAKECGCR